MKWVGKRALQDGRLEVGRVWLTRRGWRRPRVFHIGTTLVVAVGPVAVFVRAADE